MEHPLEITQATYLHDYVLQIKFNTNEEVELDLLPMIEQDALGIYEPLKKVDFFRQFHVDYTLCWDKDIDVAPEYIYFLAHKNDPQFQALFREWGYIKEA